MKNVVVRALSGIVYVALIVGAILLGWPWFLGLTSLFALIAILEFTKLSTGHLSIANTTIDCIGTLALTLSATMGVSYGNTFLTILQLSPIVVMLWFMARIVAALYDTNPYAFTNIAKSFLGVLYIGLPLTMLNTLYLMSNPSGVSYLVLVTFVMIWLNDTGAFCVGSLFGKHRLFERLSPKKSWEGFWGGLACCLICGAVCSLWIHLEYFNLYGWLIYGAIVCAFSTWGDLFESLIKRSMHVKDSGHLIPGHGGILDRIDSLLLVAPAALLFYLSCLVLGFAS